MVLIIKTYEHTYIHSVGYRANIFVGIEPCYEEWIITDSWPERNW